MLALYVYSEKNELARFYSRIAESLFKHIGHELGEVDYTVPFSDGMQADFHKKYDDLLKHMQVKKVKIWNTKAQVVYSDDPSIIGRRFEQEIEYWRAVQGSQTSEFSKLNQQENQMDSTDDGALLEVYTPIFSRSGEVVGVAEFYFDISSFYKVFVLNDHMLISGLVVLLIVIPWVLIRLIVRNKQQVKQLDRNVHFLTQLFTSSSDGIVILDDECRVLSLNPAAERISGWKQGDVAGMNCHQLFNCSHEDGRPISEANCPLKSGLHFNCGEGNNYSEFNIRHHDGGWRTVSVSYIQLEQEDGKPPHYAMQIRDVTRKVQEIAEIDIIQEFALLPHEQWDQKKIHRLVEDKCRKLFLADRVSIVWGDGENEGSSDDPMEEEIKSLILEVRTRKLLLERDSKVNLFLIGVPLIIGNDLQGVMVLQYDSTILLDLETGRKLSRLAAQTAMVYKLYSLMEHIQVRRKEMEDLYKLSMEIRSNQTESVVDRYVIESVRIITKADGTAVLLYDQQQRLRHHGSSGSRILANDELLNESMFFDALHLGQFSVLHAENEREHVLFKQEGLASVALSPIVYRDKVYGVLLIGMKTPKVWNEHDTYLIQNISSIIAVQIQNNQLYRQVENKAILLERDRISREIHDGLAQAIGYVNLQLHRISKMLEERQIEQAIREIGTVKEVIADSYGEIRETITNLRVKQTDTGFVDWVIDYIRDFQHLSGLQVELKVEENLPAVTEDVKIQLIRVVQEALTNVKKHSDASLVRVELGNANGELMVSIMDNGRGIEQRALEKRRKHGGQGLSIMKDRIESISGKFSIESKPQEGTKITIVV
ncbi:hypothetical protein EFBL_3028 [Effusibacillus lacus]|uniref:Oxygen sensor histidine kinase NreB n=2 Tax=Effusibacillus lacus TaxID=1348429 RepID=A0A292YR17_9BACL|nr:hypothetical protein EFBL_3028 [Effusibacillus lacus]